MSALQVKQVPKEIHAAVRARARELDTTVSDYLLSLIERDLRLPTQRDWFERVRQRAPLRGLNVSETLHSSRRERQECL